ncbi:MerR family DNA-binding protein [Nocardioides sp.]|uniref:MerR family DNA-binding protein n=1 Tax=Nocardioides sp. TaxID=35761 RepID=UPI002CDECB8A|nr:MerR family DNA-binding protein [Nocardioides sp.]HXH80873.1 MerR family DNA-binding protein [Nocardioides sp.]
MLRVIKAAQRLGFTLDEVADLLAMGRHRHGRSPDAGLQAQARIKLVEIEERIARPHDHSREPPHRPRRRLRRPRRLRHDRLLPAAVRGDHEQADHHERLEQLMRLRDRHLVGAGAAACAVCCAAPILGLLGIAGAAATLATLVFAGAVFAAVVGVAALAALVVSRQRAPAAAACGTVPAGPVGLELTPRPDRS